MNDRSSDSASATLTALLSDCKALERALSVESEALRMRDPEAISAAARAKADAAHAVRVQEREFLRVFNDGTRGANPGAEWFDELAERYAGEPAVVAALSDVRACLVECRRINQDNAVRTRVGLNACNRLLGLIEGSTRKESRSALYGPEGLEPVVRDGVTLGEA